MKYLVLTLVVLIAACDRPLNGTNGAPGPSGPQGTSPAPVPGPSGTPGTIVTMVELCGSSFVPTYPTTFPEYAECVGDQLYGVYSANGGFEALLPPGEYTSDGVNASCTFEVQANCVIVNQ